MTYSRSMPGASALATLLIAACGSGTVSGGDGGDDDSNALAPPFVLEVTPASPANDNQPTVHGTAEAGLTVRIFADPACAAPLAEGTADANGGFAIAVTVVDDTTTTFYANAADSAGNVSPCSTSAVTYVEDSTAPTVFLTGTTPASPADDNDPIILGTTEPGATVSLYADAVCATLVTSGAADTAGDFALAVTVADDTVTTFNATATDEAGNVSACSSSSVTYVESSGPLAAPVFTGSTPASPANDNAPEIEGTALPNAAVTLHSDAACTTNVASGVADASGLFAIAVTVADDSTTTFFATASDGVRTSSCSTTSSLTYVEDSTPPVVALTNSAPASPANENNPSIIGTSEAGAAVSLYEDAACTTPVASGVADGAGDFAIVVTVADDATTTFWATATDLAGNGSGCSASSVTYVEDSSLLAAPVFSGSIPASPANHNDPSIEGSTEAGVTVTLYTDAGCTSAAASGAADGVGAFAIAVTVPDDSTTTFFATADDGVEFSACSTSSLTYVEDSTSPTVTLTGSTPASPANDNAPTIAGSTEPNAAVSLYEDAACSAPVASGTADGAGAFAIAVTVPDDSTTTFYAIATDAAGNDSGCSASNVTYQEDSTAAPPEMLGSTPTSPANDNGPLINGTAEANAVIELFVDPACTSLAASGAANASGDFAIAVTVADDSVTTFYGTAVDPVGNGSACSSTWVSYEEDSTPPAVPVMTGTAPAGIGDSTTPAVEGTAEPGIVVRIFSDGACTSLRASGTADGAGDFSIAATVTDDSSTTFWAQARDAAGNPSACSATSATYVHNAPPVFTNLPATYPCLSGSALSFFVAASDTAADQPILTFSQGAGTTCGFAGLAVSSVGMVTGTCAFPPAGCDVEVVVDDGDATVSALLRVVEFQPVDFYAERSYATQDLPRRLMGGDLNDDGAVDLVVTNMGTDYVSVFLQNPQQAGSFFPANHYLWGDDPAHLTIEDLNDDGLLDLAVAGGSFFEHVGILFGDPSRPGTFGAPVAYAISDSPTDVASGDLNGDGLADLVVANYSADSISILPQDPGAPGTFLAASSYAAGDRPQDIALGDLNGDTYLDVATANLYSDDVSILFQDAGSPGTFLPAQTLVPGTSATTIAIGELDGDGRLDIAITDTDADSVAVLLQDPATAGTFFPAVGYACGANAGGLLISDLDGDTHPDLAVSNTSLNTLTILPQVGSTPGTFAAPISWPIIGREPFSADFDGDGLNDLATVDNARDTLLTYMQDSAAPGEFVIAPRFATGTWPVQVRVGHLDGDALLDLAVANNTSDDVSVLLQDPGAPGTFLTAVSYAAGTAPSALAVADLDGDGRDDLAVANEDSNDVSVLIQDAASPGTFLAAVSYATGIDPVAVSIGDLDGDSRLDLVVANTGSDDVSLLIQDSATAGAFLPATSLAAANGPYGLAIADLDGDARLDLAVAASYANSVVVLRQDPASAGTFLAPETYAAGSSPWGVAVGDLNGDGLPDVAMTVLPAGLAVLWQDAGAPGSFLGPTEFATPGIPRSLAIADFSGNGLADVVVGCRGPKSVSLLLQTAGAPGELVAGGDYVGEDGVAAADVDGDGRPDIVTVKRVANEVVVLLQR